MNDGVIEKPQGDILYEGPRITVQYVADTFEVSSDSTALRAVRALEKRGLVSIASVYDQPNKCRRLWIARSRSGGARTDPGPSRDKEDHRDAG